MLQEMSDWIAFKSSPIHGMGGFARTDIPSGTRVIEYTGQKITKTESIKRCSEGNWYIFALDDEFDLDGAVGWNPARFINHSCSPNCEAEMMDGHIWILSKRAIAAGEEITFNYGYDLDDYKEHPCHCGSPNCIGYMVAEEFFPELRKRAAHAQEAGITHASQEP
jgi:SET domain-containing protein